MKRKWEGEERRRARRKRSMGQIHMTLCKTTWKRLDYRVSRGRGGMNYMEMKRARHRRRESGRPQERGKRQQKAKGDWEIFIYIAVFLKHRAHDHYPYQTPPSYSDPAGRIHKLEKTCHYGTYLSCSLIFSFFSFVSQILTRTIYFCWAVTMLEFTWFSYPCNQAYSVNVATWFWFSYRLCFFDKDKVLLIFITKSEILVSCFLNYCLFSEAFHYLWCPNLPRWVSQGFSVH